MPINTEVMMRIDYAYRNMVMLISGLESTKRLSTRFETVFGAYKTRRVIYEAIGHCYHRLGKYAKPGSIPKSVSHESDDSKLFYKIALTYINEGQWASALKPLEQSMRTHRYIPEYNLCDGRMLYAVGTL